MGLAANPQGTRASAEARIAADEAEEPGLRSRGHNPDLDTETQPEQVSQVTRAFLRPLVGIDPAEVQVYRGEEASRAAGAHSADAITVQDTVFVAHGQATEGVDGAALLAHELTHVARQREPGFLPPVARHTTPAAASQDEEAVAREVESAVHHAAQAAGTDQWGGLPAPWEPLPDWLTTPPEPGPADATGNPTSAARPTRLQASGRSSGPSSHGETGADPFGEGSPATKPGAATAARGSAPDLGSTGLALAQAAASAGLISAGAADGGGMGGVLAAEHGRALDAGADVTPAAGGDQVQQQHHQQAGVEPDLDALARQVYARLKRRLAAEQRRLG